jgi:hypothetical protein
MATGLQLLQYTGVQMVLLFLGLGILSVSATIIVVSACRLSGQCVTPEKQVHDDAYTGVRPSFVRRPA